MTTFLSDLRDKIAAGERLEPADGVALYSEAPLLELGEWAAARRNAMHPGRQVTFVIDSNPNYTNVCNVDCIFCAFYRHEGEADAYTHDVEKVLEMIGRSHALGATTVLLQGGVNPKLPLDYYLAIVRGTRERYPDVTPHFFTSIEVEGMADVSGLSVREVLERLWEAGQRTLPGGGAEILSDRVRMKLGKKKGGAEAWSAVHRVAHHVGFHTTATMMYGHIETPEEIVEHLDRVRAVQDEALANRSAVVDGAANAARAAGAPAAANGNEIRAGAFTAFVPWSFKPGNTPLEKQIHSYAGPNTYLRMIALSRLYLDNVPHIQASWFSEGKKAGQVALHFGADDFGGTLFEENVHAATGFVNQTTTDEVVTLIREAGFTPVQRTTLYDVLRQY
jgi:dehypoxanthine futalosine cyclase